jgi:hypothetical protein
VWRRIFSTTVLTNKNLICADIPVGLTSAQPSSPRSIFNNADALRLVKKFVGTFFQTGVLAEWKTGFD